MADICVISDTHFNHAAILTFKDYAGKSPRTFDSVEAMNETMFNNWNSVVKPNDTVYHLGDVLFGVDKDQWLSENFSRLNGKKKLILGNHDNPKIIAPHFKSMAMWADLTKEFGLLLSHTPQHASTLAETHRFGDAPVLNVHGHIHSNPSPEGPYRCVCVEQIDYTPVNIEDLRTN